MPGRYYLRYLQPWNRDRIMDEELEKYWMPVDLYVGEAPARTHNFIQLCITCGTCAAACPTMHKCSCRHIVDGQMKRACFEWRLLVCMWFPCCLTAARVVQHTSGPSHVCSKLQMPDLRQLIKGNMTGQKSKGEMLLAKIMPSHLLQRAQSLASWICCTSSGPDEY